MLSEIFECDTFALVSRDKSMDMLLSNISLNALNKLYVLLKTVGLYQERF